MMTSSILTHLNSKQREAVTSSAQHLLVLAGAGSGKTRVLVHRIAHLIESDKLSPFSVLGVTFTNKAAAEMRGRIEQLLATPASSMWLGTFHSLSHRLLRLHWREAGLAENFQILDSDDQYRLIRRVLKAMDLDEKQWPPKQVQWTINKYKDEGKRPAQLGNPDDFYNQTLKKIYIAYEETCQRGGLIDFAELLLSAFELLRDNANILQHYQKRFRHVLVDEFQDTNTIQYAWIRMLTTADNTLTIVGDDDQSIYGWRGAKIENIQRFEKDFSDTQTIRLEQNYRSTSTILSAANAVIANNESRLGKNLWTDSNKGEAISLYPAFNEIDEARFIVSQIQRWVDQGNRRSEVALLYRSNAQSRVLEEALIQASMPYRIYGGQRFFDRAEIKDALAYLRLIHSRDDDAAFERVINTPTRGIGERTVMILREQAKQHNLSLWKAALQVIADNTLTARAHSALLAFIDKINQLAADTKDINLEQQTEHIVSQSGLYQHYQTKDRGEKAQARIENLQELITAAKQFTPAPDEDLPILAAFLSHAALEAGEQQATKHTDFVQLMTLHSAKGLEFPLVFLCGVEEGLFPHQLSVSEPGRLEEERRLCYVGMTRAMQKLYITYAESRRTYGNESYQAPSRFIAEIPKEFVEEVRLRRQVVRPMTSRTNHSPYKATFNSQKPYTPKAKQPNDSGLRMGQRVKHHKFGEGVVINYEGQGSSARIQVEFARAGTKWLVTSLAKLQTVA